MDFCDTWKLRRLCVRCFTHERDRDSYLCSACKCNKCGKLQHMNDSVYCHYCTCDCVVKDCFNCHVDGYTMCAECMCALCHDHRNPKSKYCDKCTALICQCTPNKTCEICAYHNGAYWFHYNDKEKDDYVDKNPERHVKIFVASLLKANLQSIGACVDDLLFDLVSYYPE